MSTRFLLAGLVDLVFRLMGGESSRRALSTASLPWHRRILLALVLTLVAVATPLLIFGQCFGGSATGYSVSKFLCDELAQGWACEASSAWEPSDGTTTEFKLGGYESVSAGRHLHCGLHRSGRLTCWSKSGDVLPTPSGRFKALSTNSSYNESCAVRTNGHLECWRGDGERVNAPIGSYRTVDVGTTHSCALTEDGEAVCWHSSFSLVEGPRKSYLVTTDGPLHGAPETYVAIAADDTWGNCAIREGSADIVCWEQTTQTNAHSWSRLPSAHIPDGRYTAISASWDFFCALREDGHVVCWEPWESTTSEHTTMNQFVSVSVAHNHKCGILTNGQAHCWGSSYGGRLDLPDGVRYKSVSAGHNHTCAVRADSGTIDCEGDSAYGALDAPDGQFTMVDANGHTFRGFVPNPGHVCALRPNGQITCWGRNEYGQADAPRGRYATVDVGGTHSCGVRVVSGRIDCWGDNRGGELQVPDGRYRLVSAGYGHSCALRLDHSVVCWGRNNDGQTNAPAGSFTAVSAGYDDSCAIRASDLGIECWGGRTPSDLPTGRYSAVSQGREGGCAIDLDQTLVCWGNRSFDADGTHTPDRSNYIQVDVNASGGHCATAIDGAVECWYSDQITPFAGEVMRMVTVGVRYVCGLRQRDGGIVCEGRDGVETPKFAVLGFLLKKPDLPARRRLGRVRARRLDDGRVQLGFWFVAEGEPAVLTNGTLKQKRSGEDDWQYIGPVVRGDEQWGHIRARWADGGWLELGFVLLTTKEPDVGTAWKDQLPMPLSGDVEGWRQDDDGWYRGGEIALDVGDIDRVVPGPSRPPAFSISHDQSSPGWWNVVRGLLGLSSRPASRRPRGGIWARRVRRRKGRRRRQGQ